ncbi:hypothetical protein ACFLXI_04060, partial [Chloroflexota bacterium]
LFIVSKSAKVFVVDTMQFDMICVHKIFMNFVEPIRDRKKIAQIKNQLRGQCPPFLALIRYRMWFRMSPDLCPQGDLFRTGLLGKLCHEGVT